MDRRRFLSMLSAAGAVGWSLTATGSWARPLEGVFGRPVPFIDTAAVGDQGDLFDIDGAATANHQARRYPQSVAAGDPKARACRHKISRRTGGQAAARQGIASAAWLFHVNEPLKIDYGAGLPGLGRRPSGLPAPDAPCRVTSLDRD